MVNTELIKVLVEEALEGKEYNICCTRDADDKYVARITLNKNDVEMVSATFDATHRSTVGICSNSDEAFDLYCRISTILKTSY